MRAQQRTKEENKEAFSIYKAAHHTRTFTSSFIVQLKLHHHSSDSYKKRGEENRQTKKTTESHHSQPCIMYI